jgi:glycosyltransferase involved in cell wall biosynthesis
VITNHGLKSQTAPEWFQNIYTATCAKWTFGAADKIICYTETGKQELIDLGLDPQKIAVIHNGIDTDLFVPGKEDSQNNKQLLWIGRFNRGKGVDYLVDAFKLLNSKHPNIKLLLIGRGPDRERIKVKIQDLKLDKCIAFKDFVPNTEIVKLYQSSSVFVLPSLEEGVPRTILEAMSCGIPIVCSNLPQLVDIVKDGGFLVPTKDPEALADRVSKILSNKSLAKKMGQNGRENIIMNYSWSDTVEKTLQLYSELIQ